MEFWSRLIGGVRASPLTKQSTSNKPQLRLARFKRIYNQLQQTWHASTSISATPLGAETVHAELQSLTSILREEAGVAAPHVCLAFASSARTYATISRIALTYHHERITREAVLIFNILIDSQEEELLGNAEFAKSIMAFLSRATVIGVETEAKVVELLFGIATKIRLTPDILPTWFVPRGHDSGGVSQDLNTKHGPEATYKDDFPLFYLLLQYVHHEGSVGDFARTGLLYLVESTSHSEALEGWIIESDLATLMASGLGALYSQLSRKLIVSFSKEEQPAVLVLSDYSHPPTVPEAEFSTSPDFKSHMDTFLSYLVFWQDILEHCQSVEVKQTLLDHFQILFLQQLLYPSLLESSDVDGGSVAVLTYLRRILECINHPDLIRLILHYLFAFPDQSLPEQAPSPRSRMSASRRKSLNHLTHFAQSEDKPSPTLFNLRDLIVTGVRSKSQQTVTATLKLVIVLIQMHHQYTFFCLLQTLPAGQAKTQRTIGAHNREMELLFSLVEYPGENDNLDAAYENYLKDSRDFLEGHPCLTQILAVPATSDVTNTSLAGTVPRGIRKDPHLHKIKLDDALLRSTMTLLDKFLTNSVETNLNLTETIVAIASCERISLEGWLVIDPSNYLYDDDNSDLESDYDPDGDPKLALGEDLDAILGDERDQLLALHKAYRQPFWSADDTTPVFAILLSLTHQIHIHRKEIPNFDTYLRERKLAFLVDERLTEALASIPPPIRSSQDSAHFSTSSTLSQEPGALESLSHRVFPESASTVSSGSSPPRGRQPAVSQMLPPAGKLEQSSSKGSLIPSHTIVKTHSPSQLRSDLLSSPAPRTQSLKGPEPEVMRRKVDTVSKGPVARILAEDQGGSETSSLFSVSTAANNEHQTTSVEVSLSHLLTNVVILQEFILELAAVVQVRASLFEEVQFS